MKKTLVLILALIFILSLCACGGQSGAEQKAESVLTASGDAAQEETAGLVLLNKGNEKTVSWEQIGREAFEGDLVSGEGEVSHSKYEGAELKTLLAANGIEVTETSVITVTSEDLYTVVLTGAEVLEEGKVYVALSRNGKAMENIEGGQGARLILFGEPDSTRSVKYLMMISVD